MITLYTTRSYVNHILKARNIKKKKKEEEEEEETERNGSPGLILSFALSDRGLKLWVYDS